MAYMQDELGRMIGTDSGQPGTGGAGSLTPDAFNQQIVDSSSFNVTLDSGSRNAIQWIAAKDRLLIGTSGGEWRFSGHSNKPFTPFNYDLKLQTVWGSKDMQPLVLHDAVLFVDFVGRKLREMSSVGDSFDVKYSSPDLLLLAEHITLAGGITTMAYQRNPDSIIWATLADGTLISCTYDKDQDVVAWARHPLSKGAAGDLGTGSYTPPVSTDYPLLRTTTDQDDPQLLHITAISNAEELQAMAITGNYYLTNDIDASDTVNWDSAKGFDPIGTSASEFVGTFDGCGYTISNLFINRTTDYIGLFAKTENAAKIANVTLADVDITGGTYIGALIGYCDGRTGSGSTLVQNCHSTGAIKTTGVAEGTIGGLVGLVRGLDATNRAYFYDCSSTCTVSNSGATVQVLQVGGLIGQIGDTTVKNCFATGDVTIAQPIYSDRIGGLIGFVGGNTTEITYCYATGDITGEDGSGGFAGVVNNDGSISKCYATGNVTALSLIHI